MAGQALHSSRVVTPGGIREATVSWEGQRIVAVEAGRVVREGVEFESVGARLIMPGVIDPHVHINEPGRTEWEGFDTATAAAAAGGVTTLVDMPLNSSPVTTTPAALAAKRAAAAGRARVHLGFHGGVVPTNCEALEPLLEAGVMGIKAFLAHSGIDEFPNVEEGHLRRALPALLKHDALLLVHCELPSPHAGQQALQSAPRSHAAWLASRPPEWEERAVALVLRLAEESGLRVHVVHVAAAGALEAIAAAQSRGVRVTAETCPHYLAFCAEDIVDGAVQFKCAPPIRERMHRERLWLAVASGVLSVVASDHSPAPPDLKQVTSGDFARAWGGISGLQFGLRATWTGARARGISLETLAARLCSGPADLLGLADRGRLVAGAIADLVVWDPEAEAHVTEDEVLHRHRLTPYVGCTLAGRIERTWVAGGLAYAHGRVTGSSHGRLLISRRSPQ